MNCTKYFTYKFRIYFHHFSDNLIHETSKFDISIDAECYELALFKLVSMFPDMDGFARLY